MFVGCMKEIYLLCETCAECMCVYVSVRYTKDNTVRVGYIMVYTNKHMQKDMCKVCVCVHL